MDTSGQQAFIGKIRSALGHSTEQQRHANALFTGRSTEEIAEILDRIRNRTRAERQQLLETMVEAAEPLNLSVIALKELPSVTSAIADFVRNKEPEWGDKKRVAVWKHPLIEGLRLSDTLADQNVPVYVTEFEDKQTEDTSREKKRAWLRKKIIDSYIGITSADFCMADTATLVMRTRPGQARSVSLVPSIHIAVIRLEQIIADLKELYAVMKGDVEVKKEGLTNCMTFISGPSKTADVEATMVHGAHGPREVYIYVITE